jgi:hypothetical protein
LFAYHITFTLDKFYLPCLFTILLSLLAKMMRLDDISVSVPSNTSEDKNIQVESNMVNKQGK